MKSFPKLMTHPYEVIVRNTPPNKMIICQLYDSAGNVVDGAMERSGNGETRFFLTTKVANVSALCSYMTVERYIRPSTAMK